MPDPPFDTRQESIDMKYPPFGTSLFDGAPPFAPSGGAPSRYEGAPSRSASDSDDKGKAVVVEGDTDMSGVTGKELMNVASSSSSSSSTVAETPDMYNNSASSSSSQHDEAEDTTDVPEELPISTSRSLAITTPMRESDAHSNLHNQEPRLFEDTPEQANISSGLGNYEIMRLMELPEEPQRDADPHQVQAPEDLLRLSTSIETFQIPSFSMGVAGGIVPFAEEQSVEDPDEVGLENLDIFINP